MDTIVPLAGSSVKGRLGVAHLPRLWLKALLAAANLLPEGYATGYLGTDKDVLDGIGLEPGATFALLATRPDYQVFEAWVRANARGLDPASIAATNDAIVTRRKSSGELAAAFNALEDWATVHARVAAGRGANLQPIVPAISSQSAGPLGLMHLPRFWLKATLAATGTLYDGWKSGTPSSYDLFFVATVGLDLATALAYVQTELPSYPAFEAWTVAHVPRLSPAAIAEYNAAQWLRQKPETIAGPERVTLGIDDPDYRKSIEMNDLLDWHELHAICMRARA
jgi:hypothetical protein